MSRPPFPTPYAGSYYPIYNSGVNQYIVPTPEMPFNQVSALFVAFAHAYPVDGGPAAELRLEEGQPEEPERLRLLVQVARQANPNIKILISLGWGKNDWDYIGADYQSGANRFPASVVELIRSYGLDGFDIDDESIGGSSGSISRWDFEGVVRNIRNALDQTSAEDGKPYFFTITPADGTGQVTRENMGYFDLINCQCYGGTYPVEFTEMGYPKQQIAWGIDSEGCEAGLPPSDEYEGLAGIFNWSFSADSGCGFKYTREIAEAVGYGA